MAENLDSRLLLRSFEEEVKRAAKLQEKKAQVVNQSEQSDIKRGAMAMGKVVEKHSAFEAVRQGVSYGLYLRKSIKEGGLTGGAFIMLLCLSMLKDIVDFSGASFLNPINLFLLMALFIVRAGKGSFFKRYLTKRFFLNLGLTSVPGVSFFPLTTIGTVMLKIGMDKKIRKMQDELTEIDKKTAEVEKDYNRIKV